MGFWVGGRIAKFAMAIDWPGRCGGGGMRCCARGEVPGIGGRCIIGGAPGGPPGGPPGIGGRIGGAPPGGIIGEAPPGGPPGAAPGAPGGAACFAGASASARSRAACAVLSASEDVSIGCYAVDC